MTFINMTFMEARVYKRVLELIDYCEQNNSWPKPNTNLYIWFRNNYKNGKLNCGDILIQGEKAEDIVNRLSKKYRKMSKKSNDYVIFIVDSIEEYCKKHKTGPKFYSNPQTDEEKHSNRLYNWIKRSNLFSIDEDFKYKDIIDKDGKSIEIRLKNICEKYNFKIKNSIEKIRSRIKDLENYCLTYNEWPKYIFKPQNKQQKLSSSLNDWLNRTLYNKGNFIYENVYIDGKSAKDILDELHEKYKNVNTRSKEYILMVVDDIETYILEHQEFPKSDTKLYLWLLRSGYFKGEFKYSNIVDDKGVNIKLRLDRLKDRYGKVYKETREIIEYSIKYNEWPSNVSNPVSEKDKTSDRLRKWLYYSGYMTGIFKYSDYRYTDGTSLKDVLDNCYATYTNKNFDKIDEEKSSLNIWIAKNSENVVLSIYYYILAIYKSLDEEKRDSVKYYKDALKDKLKTNGYNLDINLLINLYYESLNEQRDYFYQEYIKYSIANNELALLYKNLFNYVELLNNAKLSRG